MRVNNSSHYQLQNHWITLSCKITYFKVHICFQMPAFWANMCCSLQFTPTPTTCMKCEQHLNCFRFFVTCCSGRCDKVQGHGVEWYMQIYISYVYFSGWYQDYDMNYIYVSLSQLLLFGYKKTWHLLLAFQSRTFQKSQPRSNINRWHQCQRLQGQWHEEPVGGTGRRGGEI